MQYRLNWCAPTDALDSVNALRKVAEPMRRLCISTFVVLSMISSLFHAQICAAAPAVRIGLVADLSSIAGQYGVAGYRAAALAVEEINDRGGLLGRQLELLKRDGGNNPDQHHRHVDTLAADPRVAVVLGVGSSLSVAAASDAARRNKLPLLAALGNAATITIEDGHPYIFQFQPDSSMETKSWAMFMTLFPWKKYAWVGPDYGWGHSIYANFIKAFEDIGADITIVPTLWHPLGQDDFTAIIRKIKSVQPEMLILATWGNDIVRFYQDAEEQNLFEQMGVFGRFPENISETTGENIAGNIWVPSRGPFKYLAARYTRARQFVRTYKARYGTYPNSIAICCYDAMLAWAAAVKKAGRFEREAVAAALKGIEFEGLRGQSYIRAVDGQMNSSTFFGLLVYDPQYGSSVLNNVVEVKAEQTWLAPEDVLKRRFSEALD